MNGAEQHKELVLSMMLNTLKYREARIPALEKAIERFEEAIDAESIKETADLRQTLERNKQRLTELRKATRWLLDEWPDMAINGTAIELERLLIT